MTAPNAGLVVITTDELKAIVREQLEEVLGARAIAMPKRKGRVSTTELADALGVSRSKVHELADAKVLPFVWCGDHRRFDVDECIAALKNAPAPEKHRAGPGRGKRK
jgi:excisionase family DNA binding protein